MANHIILAGWLNAGSLRVHYFEDNIFYKCFTKPRKMKKRKKLEVVKFTGCGVYHQ